MFKFCYYNSWTEETAEREENMTEMTMSEISEDKVPAIELGKTLKKVRMGKLVVVGHI